jgi:hypothetical protein
MRGYLRAEVLFVLSLSAVFGGCGGDDSKSDTVSETPFASISIPPCNQGLVYAYNQLLSDAQSLDQLRGNINSGADLENYKEAAHSLRGEAETFESNYSSVSCQASRDGELVQVDPAKAAGILSILDQQTAAINAYEQNHASNSPSLPTLPSVVGSGTPAPSGTATATAPTGSAADGQPSCDQMVADERRMTSDTEDLSQQMRHDFDTSLSTNRSTAEIRDRLSNFESRYSGLSCSNAGMSEADFSRQFRSTLDDLDETIRRIHTE